MMDPLSFRTRLALLGEHTGEILQSLGYDEAEIAALHAEKVI
jgi:crotonobetainyl-CoA:carnitine CoA-transferase CaiB-like acyl-CoA transferase